MKKLKYYLLVFLFISSFSLKSQEFLEIGKKWHYEYNEYNWGTLSYNNTTIQTISITGDSIVNDTSYFILEFSKNLVCLGLNSRELLRDENGKIYRYDQFHELEMLVMDFENPNDYFIQYYGYINQEEIYGVVNANVTTDSIGSYTIYDGTELEVRYLGISNDGSFGWEYDTTDYVLLEHVGFIEPAGRSMLYPDLGTGLCDTPDYMGEIRCITTESDTIKLSQYDCDEVPFGVNNQNIEQPVLNIYPNPSTGEINIPSGWTVKSIFDMRGIKYPFKQNETNLFISNISKGIYIIQLENDLGKIVNSKITII